jgi:hypothetical protein
MKTAFVTRFTDSVLIVRDAEGREWKYVKEDGVESPSTVHADFVWPKGFEKPNFCYDGELPEEIFVKDGGLPLNHRYRKKGQATDIGGH